MSQVRTPARDRFVAELPPFGQSQRRLLIKYYNFSSLRPKQQEAVDALLKGHDVCVTAPTGYGKSICYILPALVMYHSRGGDMASTASNETSRGTAAGVPRALSASEERRAVTIVVSPLLALISDQVAALRRRGVPVAQLSSAETSAANSSVLARLSGPCPLDFALLYVTAERVTSASFVNILAGMQRNERVGAFAIDEAHCISQWGHDFRKAYSALGCLRKNFPDVPIIALTATATHQVERSIRSSLSIPSAVRVHKSFLRENIRYEVRYADGSLRLGSVEADMVSFIKARPEEAGIVYAHKRTTVESLVERLKASGVACVGYHGGMTPKTKKLVQEQYETGAVTVIVATTAFGMGIDKANVRYVLNHSLPSSVEAFYQESGRAGRDGKPSVSILYYSEEDASLKRFLASTTTKNDEASQAQAAQRAAAVDAMVAYCTAVKCRRVKLLAHFGEKARPSEVCGVHGCDVCSDVNDVRARMRPTVRRTRTPKAPGIPVVQLGRQSITPAAEFQSARMLERSRAPVDSIDYDPDSTEVDRKRITGMRGACSTSQARLRNKTIEELIADEEQEEANARRNKKSAKDRIRDRLKGANELHGGSVHFQSARTVLEASQARNEQTHQLPVRNIRDDISGFSSDSSVEFVGSQMAGREQKRVKLARTGVRL